MAGAVTKPKLRALLIEEGYREFRGVVMRSNTRMHRAMIASGWELRPDPDNPELLRGRLVVEDCPGDVRGRGERRTPASPAKGEVAA